MYEKISRKKIMCLPCRNGKVFIIHLQVHLYLDNFAFLRMCAVSGKCGVPGALGGWMYDIYGVGGYGDGLFKYFKRSCQQGNIFLQRPQNKAQLFREKKMILKAFYHRYLINLFSTTVTS